MGRLIYRPALLFLTISLLTSGQTALCQTGPLADTLVRKTGDIRITSTNFGQFSNGIYPWTAGRKYLNVGGLWVGAVVGRDTLVSTGIDDFGTSEFWPDHFEGIRRLTSQPDDDDFSPYALSEDDAVATYYDTNTNANLTGIDQVDSRLHHPLNIRVEERSYSWSYEYAKDFIIFDYKISNIGMDVLRSMYVGLYIDADNFIPAGAANPALRTTDGIISGSPIDDLCGFLPTTAATCGFLDRIDLAYIMDNDGDPVQSALWSEATSLREAIGARILRTPSTASDFAFNWWITGPGNRDFGPRQVAGYRDMNGRVGTPVGDANKYYIMSNQEVDYDQITSAISQTFAGWASPNIRSRFYAYGENVRFLLSTGPFTLFPGQSESFTIALVGGRNVKGEAPDFRATYDATDPSKYMRTLDFDDLGDNGRWAGWLYDNPGIDTDNDGYFGETRDCVIRDTMIIESVLVIDSIVAPPDTTIRIDTNFVPLDFIPQYFSGDGVPDFRGAAPPPSPKLRVYPSSGQLLIRWNGHRSETAIDPFSGVADFEGYRVYCGLGDNPEELELKTTWDFENFNRYTYNHRLERFELLEPPFTLEQLHARYGPGFDPLRYPRQNPFRKYDPATGGELVYYFSKQDYNNSVLNVANAIYKRFPEATKPPRNTALWAATDTTEDGFLKFYEYEFTIDNLLPSQRRFVSVTAFDFGSPKVDLPSLESNPLLNIISEFPLTDASEVDSAGLDVVVYPNPYRADAGYRRDGFEGRGSPYSDDFERRIHFVNLPHECMIRIFSIDGDLIREIPHAVALGASESMHQSWDLITRNRQPASSGLYYWVVETPDGRTQIGKLVLIM